MFDFFKVQKVAKEIEKVQIAKDYENIPDISKYIKEVTGIDFEDQAVVFKSKVTSFCRTHKIESFKSCLSTLDTLPELKQELINYLTTNESFFYREVHQINSLVKTIKETSKSVKVLCAPSAKGEEPYSITIALLEAGVSASRFQITGIDISSDAIATAQKAIYNEKAIRNLNDSIRQKYFSRDGNEYKLNQEIKNKVTFICVNIFDDDFKRLGKFDYIFSRNMLIYFDTPTRIKAQNIFKEQLVNSSTSIYYGHADLTHEYKV